MTKTFFSTFGLCALLLAVTVSGVPTSVPISTLESTVLSTGSTTSIESTPSTTIPAPALVVYVDTTTVAAAEAVRQAAEEAVPGIYAVISTIPAATSHSEAQLLRKQAASTDGLRVAMLTDNSRLESLLDSVVRAGPWIPFVAPAPSDISEAKAVSVPAAPPSDQIAPISLSSPQLYLIDGGDGKAEQYSVDTVVGSPVTLLLRGNASTGYSYVIHPPVDPTLDVGRIITVPEAKLLTARGTPVIGAPTTYSLTIRPTAPGRHTVKLFYHAPGRPDVGTSKEIHINVLERPVYRVTV